MNTSKQDQALERVRRSERRYNIAKVILIIISTATTVTFVYFQANNAINKMKEDNRKTRDTIFCVIDSFAMPLSQRQQVYDQCKKDNR